MNKGLKVLFLLFSVLFLLACFCDGSGGTAVQSTPNTPKEHKAVVHPDLTETVEPGLPPAPPAPPPEPGNTKVEILPNFPAINLPIFTFDATATIVPGGNNNPSGSPANPLVPPPAVCTTASCIPR